MLTIEKITNIIFKSGSWKTHDLLMTPNGFQELEQDLNEIDKKSPQVYIHIGTEGDIKNKVLRIGKAESGIHYRWLKSKNGHYATFSWAIGSTDKYGETNAKKYPHYLLFFASLYKQNTKLHVLACQNDEKGKQLAKVCEKALICCCLPLWEEIRKLYIEYLSKNNNHQEVAEFGNALKMIKKDINGLIPNLHELSKSIGRILEIEKIQYQV